MARPRWNIEQEQWLIENVKGKDWQTLTEMFNAEFGTDKKLTTIRGYANRTLKITNERDTHFYKGMKQWNDGMPKEEWQKHFTEETWKKYIERPMTGNKQDVPIGTKHYGGNAVEIKTKDGWKRLSRHIYEQAYGKLTNDDVIIHLDGDKENFELDNLYKASKRVAGRTYKTFGKVDGNPDRMKVCLKSIELADLIGI